MVPESHARILVVDDDADYLETLSDTLIASGYDTEQACCGQDALAILRERPDDIDVILLDRKMPEMDGIDVLRSIKQHPDLAYVPVIMQTGQRSAHDVREGIEAGAHYYLTKPFDKSVLLSIVKSAANDFSRKRAYIAQLDTYSGAHTMMQSGTFVFRTFEEAERLATFLASLCPNPITATLGLSELLENAVEHGNLEIGYAAKTQCIKHNTRFEEIHRRQHMEAYAARTVTVHVERKADLLVFTIRDQGDGFDWTPYLTIDPNRVGDPNGRGIALAHSVAFDSVQFQGCGNEVVCTVRLSSGD